MSSASILSGRVKRQAIRHDAYTEGNSSPRWRKGSSSAYPEQRHLRSCSERRRSFEYAYRAQRSARRRLVPSACRRASAPGDHDEPSLTGPFATPKSSTSAGAPEIAVARDEHHASAGPIHAASSVERADRRGHADRALAFGKILSRRLRPRRTEHQKERDPSRISPKYRGLFAADRCGCCHRLALATSGHAAVIFGSTSSRLAHVGSQSDRPHSIRSPRRAAPVRPPACGAVMASALLRSAANLRVGSHCIFGGRAWPVRGTQTRMGTSLAPG